MKKTFIYLLIFVLSFQMFSFRNVVADDEKIALDVVYKMINNFNK